MNPWHSIQVPISITFVLSLILLTVGWNNDDQLSQLRKTHQDLTIQADTLESGRTSTRKRSIDRTPDVEGIAMEFIAIGIEFKSCFNDHLFSQLDPDSKNRVMEQVDLVLSLNQKGLQQLIEIIVGQPELDQRVRQNLLNFALLRWTELNPGKALNFLTHSPKLTEQLGRGTRLLITRMTHSWARESSDEITTWLRESRGTLDKNNLSSITYNLAQAMVVEQPFETIALINEFIEKPHGYLPVILRNNDLSISDRVEVWAHVREMAQELEGTEEKEKFLTKNLKALILGQKNKQGDLQTAINTIKATNLKTEDIEFIWNPAINDLGYYIKDEQTGDWINWLRKSVPEEQGRQRIKQLLKNWTRRDPAGAAAFASEHGL